MSIGILLLVVLIALMVLGIRKATGREGRGMSDGHAVGRFFRYLLLYGLLVVAASGLSGLLGRLLERGALVPADRAELALSVAFTIVGVPLFAGVALWSRRTFAEDPGEARSFGWSVYVTAASLTALAVAMFALYGVLAWATGLEAYDGGSLARFIVWGAVWGAHWWLNTRLTPVERSRVHHLLGSLIGLGTAAAGLGGLLAGAIASVLELGGQTLLGAGGEESLRGAVTLAVGAPVWLVYWVRTAARSERDPFWLAYVLLAGVGGGLVTAVVSASIVFYDVLVWLVGEPGTTVASRHFQNLPDAAAAAVVGLVVWWYHHAVLGETAGGTRTEVQRIYEYLMAGIGLLAAAGGLTMVLVALIEAVTGSAVIVGSAVNTLIAATTLLVVGGPVWWFFWRRIEAAARAAPQEEHASPTRRVYLFLLFGVAGVAAVIALLIGVFFLVEDILGGFLGAETIRRMRFPIGILVSAGAISGYHWMVYRAEREKAVARFRGPHFVLLVGPRDPEVVRAVARRTGGQVKAWPRTDEAGAPWSADGVMAALGDTTAQEVIVLSDTEGLHTIPVHRG